MIRNFATFGIGFSPNSSTLSQLFVSNTLVSDNGNGGIEIFTDGSGTTKSVLDHVQMENNNGPGLAAETTTQTVNVTVTDCVSANNGSSGILSQSFGGTVAIMVRNSTISNNSNSGLDASRTGATIRVTRSTITGNDTGWATSLSGVVLSYGDNNIDGNTNVNTEPPNPLIYH